MQTSKPMTRTRIKICGITRLEDALEASKLGVDAVGFVFYNKSPRYIDPQKAASIIRQLPPFVSAVGLFVNPSQEFIAEVLQTVPLGVIQLHGDETPDFCAAQRRRVMKAIAVSSVDDLNTQAASAAPYCSMPKHLPVCSVAQGRALTGRLWKTSSMISRSRWPVV